MQRRAAFVLFAAGIVPGSGRAQWTAVEEAQLMASDGADFDEFGLAVAADVDTVVVGARSHSHGIGPLGHVVGLGFDPANGSLFACDAETGRVLVVDSTTGAATVVPSSYYGCCNTSYEGMAFDPTSGALYVSYVNVTVSGIGAFDLATGLPNYLEGPLGFQDVRALAFDPQAQVLYGVDTITDTLITIDTATGVGTAVGALGFTDVRALALHPGAGVLYGCDSASGQLLSIDPAAGLATAVGFLGTGPIDGLAFDTAQGLLLGSDATGDELFAIDPSTGASVAIAPLTGLLIETGSAYVFERSGGAWSETAELIGSGPDHHRFLGTAVAVSGDTAAVGSPGNLYSNQPPKGTGSVHVFVRSGGSWSEQARLQPSDGQLGDRFGVSVALEGDRLLVGAPNDDHSGVVDAGSAYVFERTGTTWNEVQKLVSADASTNDSFGYVALSGGRALIGAPFKDLPAGPLAGAAYVFAHTPSGWVQEARLTRDPLLEYKYNWFGLSVALSGDRALVGAPFYPASYFSGEGGAWIFQRLGGGWTEVAQLTKPGKPVAGNECFGWAVALSGDRALIGRAGWESDGSVHMFRPAGTKWKQKGKVQASSPLPLDSFAAAVAISHDTVVTGAPRFDPPGGHGVGAAWIHRLIDPPLASFCTAGTSASGCVATLTAAGTPSASAPSGFVVSAASVEGARSGLFVYGTGLNQVLPWGNGTSFLCVSPPLRSGGPMMPAGNAGACDGSFALDLNARWCPSCPKPEHNPGEGAVVQVQLWYRDPLSTSSQPTSASDAIEFTLGP